MCKPRPPVRGSHLALPPLSRLSTCNGKTAVSWRIFTEIARVQMVAYVDIDQLGICYPEPADDPGRHRLKARNLAALLGSVAEAGIACLVVSGVVDPAHGPHLDELGVVDLTVARLHASPEVLRHRLITRDRHRPEDFEAVLSNAHELDASRFADLTVDTTALTVEEVADRVRREAGGWPANMGRRTTRGSTVARARPVRGRPAAGGQVLLLIGATGSGKSTVGWQLFRSALESGQAAAFIDFEQIGFVLPPSPDDVGRHRRRASLLASMWAAYRDVGARYLVVVGAAHDADALDEYKHALSPSRLTICRLHAGEDLAKRILQRGQGAGPLLPGDALLGAPPSQLWTITAKASEEAERIEREALGDVRLDTNGRSVDDVVAAALLALPTWPGGS